MASPLKRVSKLSITFLIDNSIEWMTKLPPGFTHEILHQIHESPIDEEKGGIPILNFNDFCCGAHGFSALIETQIDLNNDDQFESHLTLFDTGPDSLSLVRNLRALQVPITRIKRVVTSHWHSDHTGGLLSFLKLRNECAEQGLTTPQRTSTVLDLGAKASGLNDLTLDAPPPPCIVDVHPSRPLQRGIAPPPTHQVLCALPLDPSFYEIASLGGVLETHDEGHTVASGAVWISGEIPRITDFEGGLLSGVRWVDDQAAGGGKWVSEPHLMDERYAAVDVEGKGLVVFSSCSHAGIINVVKNAVKTFNRPIYMIVGGLHLASSDLYPRIEPTVDFLSKSIHPSPTFVLPMHCTGWKAKLALEKELGEAVVPAGVGHKIEILGTKADDEKLWVKIA